MSDYTGPEITDDVVESVMLDLMTQQVEVVRRFNRPLRDKYLDDIRDVVRGALRRGFDPDLRAREWSESPAGGVEAGYDHA